ncbi:WbqC family protein [Vibrio diazotrophicus]|uniref:WbqC family protein n=1 Tax=Vibrio diazotrophicus TaxID=685 RepID=UPI00142DD589|nr:WbqC family protein [Vibrio diazotrophicus]NIY94216.1 WbqC family protein [Vibrio diazotrophicus]
MACKVAISQSNYIPWKGYFDLIANVDVFVLYDDMQYTKRDWRNRNKIQTINGPQWLTIPVEVKGKYFQRINETITSDNSWRRKHWAAISQNYSKSKFFEQYRDVFASLYLNNDETYLSKINALFIKEICLILGIDTKIISSSDFTLGAGKSEKLLNICKALNANTYVSGPAAKNYLSEDLFEQESISVEWMDYKDYQEYTQVYQPFEHSVTVLDLIFNEGHNARKFMKY